LCFEAVKVVGIGDGEWMMAAVCVQDTEAKLRAGNMKVATLSGNMSKEQRQTILAKFKKGEFRALVVSGASLTYPLNHFAQPMQSYIKYVSLVQSDLRDDCLLHTLLPILLCSSTQLKPAEAALEQGGTSS
jgi:hypothetical protein